MQNSKICLVCFFLQGCLTSPNFQKAEVVKLNAHQFYTGITLQGIKVKTPQGDEDDRIIQSLLEKENLLGVVLGYRTGLDLHWDLGLELSVPGRFYGDVKAQIIEQDKHKVALGVGLGAMLYKLTDEEHFFRSLILPLYYTYDYTEDVSVFSSVRWHDQRITSKDILDNYVQVDHIVVLSFGAQYKRYAIEATVSNMDGNNLLQWSFGLAYQLSWTSINSEDLPSTKEKI